MSERAAQQPDQFGRVLRLRDGHVGNGKHICDVVQPHVCLTVRSDHSCTIHAKDDRQPLDSDIVDDAVVSTLQKRGIDRHYRTHALRCQSRRERRPVSLRNPDIEETIGPFLLEDVRSRP